MADIKQIKVGNTTYDIKDNTKLPLTGGEIDGNLTVDGNIYITGYQEKNGMEIDNALVIGDIKYSPYGIYYYEYGMDEQNYGLKSSFDAASSRINLYGGTSKITLDGFGESGGKIVLSSDTERDFGLHFTEENNELIGSITGLANATSNDQAVPLGQVNSLINDKITSKMTFKGTASSLPSNPASGDMYKVTTAIAKTSKMDAAAKVGDTIIYNGTMWYVIPSGDDIEDTWRTIQVNDTQLLGGGTTTGAVNFKSGNGITVSGSGKDVTVAVSTDFSNKLNGKLDKTGGTMTGTLHFDYHEDDEDGNYTGAIELYNNDSGSEVILTAGHLSIDHDGSYTSINAQGLHTRGDGEYGARLRYNSLRFYNEDGENTSTVSGLRDAEEDDEAVPFGQLKAYVAANAGGGDQEWTEW